MANPNRDADLDMCKALSLFIRGISKYAQLTSLNATHHAKLGDMKRPITKLCKMPLISLVSTSKYKIANESHYT